MDLTVAKHLTKEELKGYMKGTVVSCVLKGEIKKAFHTMDLYFEAVNQPTFKEAETLPKCPPSPKRPIQTD